MANLYPSLEDMKVDQMMQAQTQAMPAQTIHVPSSQQHAYPTVPATDPREAHLPYPLHPTAAIVPASVYPELGGYMGMEFTEQTIRDNMPEYLSGSHQVAVRPPTQVGLPTAAGGVVAPISGSSPAFQKSQINHNVRQVILCKDKDGRVGLRVRSVDKGVFVALVTKGSPSAMGGLRFGDQILQINGDNVAGYTESQVHKIFQKASVNNIVLAVRDRPFERTITLHKDSTGHIGFQFKDGEIRAIVVGSSAARNGLLINHNLVEINGQNVVGISDKEISEIIDSAGSVVTVTIVPSYVYRHMMKNMSSSLIKKMMDHSIPDM